ncbi:hypothetical protein ABT314_12545 [Streptomyces spiralis]
MLAATALAATTAVAGLVGAVPAQAAPVTLVRCPAQNLQTAIDSVPAGSTLLVSGTCTGNFTIDKNLSLVGLGATLDGNRTGTVVTVAAGVRAQLTNLRITNGLSSGPFQGGGITNLGTLTLTRSSLTSNNATFYGGGIYNSGAVTLTGSTVSANGGNLGGGIFNGGGTVRLTSSTVSGNFAVSGAGVFTSDGTVQLVGTRVTHNSASTVAGGGGGIVNGFGTVTLTNSTVDYNTGWVSGGIDSSGTTRLTNSQVSRNTATTFGGGIRNIGGPVTLTNSTVDHNQAGTDGGGIYNTSVFGTATVTLNRSRVFTNTPNNCAPPGSVPGCSG